MTTQLPQENPPLAASEYRPHRSLEAAGAGATAEAVGAAAAIVLAIIGLAGTLTFAMMTIATIVLGGALLMDASGVAARYDRLVVDALGRESMPARAQVGGGLSAESLGALAGIVLGILGLLGFLPVTLCAAALIVFGAALLFGSAIKSRFASMAATELAVPAGARRVIDEMSSLSAGGDVLVGLAAIVLGILALLGAESVTLVLVGQLAVGIALLLSGSSLGARMFALLRHGA